MTRSQNLTLQPAQGFTLLEVLLVVAVIGMLSSLSYSSYLNFQNPARDTARAVHASLYQLRATAAANTQARRMVLNSGGQLELQRSLSCSEADQSKWVTYDTVPLPNPSVRRPVTLTRQGGAINPNVIVCYSPRGLAAIAGTLNISDTKTRYAVQAALSGGVKTSAQ